jgi:hypothetical protein
VVLLTSNCVQDFQPVVQSPERGNPGIYIPIISQLGLCLCCCCKARPLSSTTRAS